MIYRTALRSTLLGILLLLFLITHHLRLDSHQTAVEYGGKLIHEIVIAVFKRLNLGCKMVIEHNRRNCRKQTHGSCNQRLGNRRGHHG